VYHRIPLRDGKNESVHLAPTLLRESWGFDGGEGAPRGVPEAYIEGESESYCCRTARLPQAPILTGVDPAWEQLRQVCIEMCSVVRRRNVTWRLSGTRIKLLSSRLSVSRAGHLGRVSRRGRKVSYLCRMVERGKNACKSQELRSVYLMGLRGSDGGRHFARTCRCTFALRGLPSPRGGGRGSATVPGTRGTFGSESEGTACPGWLRWFRRRGVVCEGCVSGSGGITDPSSMRESRASHVSRFDEGDARVKIEIPIIKEGDAAKGGRACDLGEGNLPFDDDDDDRDLVPDPPGRVTPARC
jgi:hypothetical protein